MKKAQKKKHRNELGVYFMEGEHVITEALKAEKIEHLMYDERFYATQDALYYDSDDSIFLQLPNNVLVDAITNEIGKKISATPSPQGVYALGKIEKEDLTGDEERILILDGVQDPGNAGTMIRSAVSFGFDAVIFTDDSVDMYNEKVLRSTQGMHFQIKLITLGVEEIKEHLIKNELLTYILDMDGISSRDIKPKGSFAILAGQEGQGVRREHWTEIEQEIVTIPMTHAVDSLNVAVATSIMMYICMK